MIENIIYLLLGLSALVFGGELFVSGAKSLALRLSISPLIIGLTLVAFGTSTPELAVSIKAAMINSGDISIGNVIGSNSFNLMFILSLCALISPLPVKYEFLKLDIPVMIGSTILLGIFLWDGTITKIESCIFILSACIYLFLLFSTSKDNDTQNESSNTSWLVIFSYLVFGLFLLAQGSDFTIKNAISIARLFNIEERIIGLTIIAAGTSLPELITSVVATRKGERELAIGNVIGSNILNILVIIGVSGLINLNALNASPKMISIDFSYLIIGTLIGSFFLRSGRILSRLEGSILILSYIGYVVYLIGV